MTAASRDRGSSVAVWLLLPPVALLVGLIVSTAVGWREPHVNLAEATVLKDAGEMQRRLWAGADPRARERVRGGQIMVDSRDDLWLTPMEAAIYRNRPDLAHLLLLNGAVADPDETVRLRCLAEQQRARDVARLIEAEVPDAARGQCPAIPVPWQRGDGAGR